MTEKLGLWLIIDVFVRIITMLAVVTLLAKTYSRAFMTFLVIVFMLWAFRPLYLSFREFKIEMQKKKVKQKIKPKLMLFNTFLFYFLIFILSVIFFFIEVTYLGALVHPLVLTFSFMLSAFLIVGYHHIFKKEFKGPLWSFSKFFLITMITLFVSVLFFSSYGLSKGINPEPVKVNFDAYVINNALSKEELNDAINYSKNLWENYNISLNFNNIRYEEINLSKEEVMFLFSNGSKEEDCVNYKYILDKIINNSSNLSIIFLNNKGGTKESGRGSLCNRSFALVSPEKLNFIDFTGWNTAHEVGHVLGLTDIQFYARARQNLMNDETKKLFFYNSKFLDQSQIDIVIKTIKNKNENPN